MSALAHISRILALLFTLLAVFWISLPFLNVLGRTYEGGAMLLTCFLFADLFGVIGVMLYGCYRYARLERGNPVIRGLLWCFVVATGLGASALAARIVWLTVPAFTR